MLEQLVPLIEEIRGLKKNDPLITPLRAEILQMLDIDSSFIYTVLISGIQPGTGSSTLKDTLNEILTFPEYPDAGFYRRAIARYWVDQPKGTREERIRWRELQEFFQTEQDMIIDVLRILYSQADLNDDVLSVFNAAQAEFATDEDRRYWEKLPDNISIAQLVASRSEGKPAILQGKLTAVIDRILQLPLPSSAIPLLRVLLTIDDKTEAARRVMLRENIKKENNALKNNRKPRYWTIEDAFSANERRYTRDWENFQNVYGISPIIFQDADVLHIDTSRLSASEVVARVLVEMTRRVRD